MSRITTDLTLEDVDNFFKIGKKIDVRTVARSKSGGRALDPATGKPVLPKPEPFIPPYKRHAWHNNPDQKAYARKYQQEEEEQLTGAALPRQVGSSGASSVSGMMERLEIDSTITGVSTLILPEGKSEEEANKVYSNYRFNHNYDQKLSITKYREGILENIESNQVVVIKGPTGSGKTTQVPQYILDHYASMDKYCNVIVTQPRRIAAESIAGRVCLERGWQQGGICGFQVGMKRQTSEDTRLLYCTTGVLLEKLIAARHMQHYTHIILDEVHERDQDTDFALLVVRKYLRSNSRDVKVILMSATAEAEKFAQYFAIPIRGFLEPVPIIEVEGRTYPVSDYYVEQLDSLGTIPRLDPENPGISRDAYDLAVKLVTQFDSIEGDSEARGAVLIFLPGLAEIQELEEKLSAVDQKHKKRWWILPLHSTITSAEQARVFNKPTAAMRKIILSTNIAESSITVPDIKYVIDFCLTKNLVCDQETSYTSLHIQWTSQSSCDQRKGRAGRTSSGRTYKMVTRDFYKNFLPKHAQPEMERCPLDILVLKSKLLNVGEPKEILALALDPPLLDNIEVTVLKLKEIGALSPLCQASYDPYDGNLTFMGRVLAKLPVDVHLGKLMLLGHVFGCLEDTIIIAACLALKSFFAKPYKSYLKSYKTQLNFANNSFSDCIAYLNAYKVWDNKKKTGGFAHPKHENQWGSNSFIQIRRIHEVELLVTDLTRRLRDFNVVVPQLPQRRQQPLAIPDEQQEILLKLVFCGAFYPNFFTQGHVDEEDLNKAMSGRDPKTTVMVKGLPQNQGPLYRKQLENHFSYCTEGIPPKISFEETKAFIEFSREPSDVAGMVLPAVYTALKMRQLRKPPEVEILEPAMARRLMEELNLLQHEKAKNNARLRTNRVKAMNEALPASNTFGARYLDPPSAIETIIPIYITEVITCGHFWAHKSDPDTWNGLCSLQDQINQNNGRNHDPLPEERATQGSYCLAPFMDLTREYYRARIDAMARTNIGTKQARVFFVDYGNSATCDLSELKHIESKFLELPFQSMEFQLSGIKPSPLKCPNGIWTDEAKDFFYKQVYVKGSLYAKIFSIVHGVMRVELIEKQSSREINLNTKLVDLNYADECAESLLSKKSHEEREMAGLMSPSLPTSQRCDFDLTDLTDPSRPKSNPFPLTEASKSSGYTVEDWMEVPAPKSFDPGRYQGQGRMVRLQGPDSVYEMKFYSMTSIGSLREARIDRDSVNSVAINDAVHLPHQRLMVAAYVGLNPSGNTVMARDTTILPLIPGLPAIVALTFCPHAELRTDRERTRYTGALCGLGHNDETGGPVMQEHDVEVTFDATFDREDLKLINGVRMGIHLVLGMKREYIEWDQRELAKIQQNTSTKLLQLIHRRRQPVNPYYFHKVHQWKCVSEEHTLYPEVDVEDDFPLHCGVMMSTMDSDDGDSDEEDTQTIVAANPAPPPQRKSTGLWEYKMAHINDLHSKVSMSTVQSINYCELCRVKLITPRELGYHLQLRTHKDKEDYVRMQLRNY